MPLNYFKPSALVSDPPKTNQNTTTGRRRPYDIMAKMASSETHQQFSTPAPSSPSAGGFETRDYFAAQVAPRPSSQDESHLTPYLGLRARLSQTWINRWTILLLLVLVRTLFAIGSLDDNLGQARQQALSMCTSVENVGSAMASMPHYMSYGVNDLTAKSVTKAINALMDLLLLTITGIEEIVLFVINLLTSTYLCLITLAVGGSLHVAIAVAEDVGNFLNSTVQSVGKDLGSAATDFQNAMNGFMSDIDKVGSFLSGHHLTPPTVDFTSEINTLDGLKLPAGYDQGLNSLNASIPTFAQVHNFTNNAISLPFEEVKKLLNESLPKYNMESSIFPVPQKQQLTFCSDNKGVNSFFDELVAIERMALKIFLVVLIVLAIAAMVPMAYREILAWRSMKKKAEIVKCDALDPMDAVYIVSRPYTARAGLKLSERFSSFRRKALVRWAVAYATTIPALFVLSLAIAGLLSCLCQYILLKAMEKEIPILETQVDGFADKVLSSLNNASEQWAVGTNQIIFNTNTKINHDVFGWVNTTTSAVNETLNVFVDGMVDALNVTFGGTVLYEPILDVLNCLIILKIEGIEKGLTWVSDNAYIEIPEIANNTFSLNSLQNGTGSSADILNTGTNTGAGGNAPDAMTGAVGHVMNFLAKTIRQEAIISFCLLLIWVFIAFIGIGRAIVLFFSGVRSDDDSFIDKDAALFNNIPSPPPPPPTQQDNFAHSGVPTYEQATCTSGIPGDHNANKYNGQAYTINPSPLPTFEVNGASPIMNTGFNPPNEKVGTVNGQYVDAAIRRQTHVRSSSYGDYQVTSPNMSPPTANPFLGLNEIHTRKQNPFADPNR